MKKYILLLIAVGLQCPYIAHSIHANDQQENQDQDQAQLDKIDEEIEIELANSSISAKFKKLLANRVVRYSLYVAGIAGLAYTLHHLGADTATIDAIKALYSQYSPTVIEKMNDLIASSKSAGTEALNTFWTMADGIKDYAQQTIEWAKPYAEDLINRADPYMPYAQKGLEYAQQGIGTINTYAQQAMNTSIADLLPHAKQGLATTSQHAQNLITWAKPHAQQGLEYAQQAIEWAKPHVQKGLNFASNYAQQGFEKAKPYVQQGIQNILDTTPADILNRAGEGLEWIKENPNSMFILGLPEIFNNNLDQQNYDDRDLSEID